MCVLNNHSDSVKCLTDIKEYKKKNNIKLGDFHEIVILLTWNKHKIIWWELFQRWREPSLRKWESAMSSCLPLWSGLQISNRKRSIINFCRWGDHVMFRELYQLTTMQLVKTRYAIFWLDPVASFPLPVSLYSG